LQTSITSFKHVQLMSWLSAIAQMPLLRRSQTLCMQGMTGPLQVMRTGLLGWCSSSPAPGICRHPNLDHDADVYRSTLIPFSSHVWSTSLELLASTCRLACISRDRPATPGPSLQHEAEDRETIAWHWSDLARCLAWMLKYSDWSWLVWAWLALAQMTGTGGRDVRRRQSSPSRGSPGPGLWTKGCRGRHQRKGVDVERALK
jgi:hypothetical protein